jgi:hypothetical protein
MKLSNCEIVTVYINYENLYHTYYIDYNIKFIINNFDILDVLNKILEKYKINLEKKFICKSCTNNNDIYVNTFNNSDYLLKCQFCNSYAVYTKKEITNKKLPDIINQPIKKTMINRNNNIIIVYF